MPKYMFVSGGDACGACSALDGTISDGGIGPQHDNCQCQDIAVNEKDDCPSIDVENVTVQLRTNGPATVSAEITVHCCDGSEIGESFEQDLGPMSRDTADAVAAFTEFAEAAGEEMAAGCPEEGGGFVDDGEGTPT